MMGGDPDAFFPHIRLQDSRRQGTVVPRRQAAFDPAYDSHPLEHFASLVRKVLHR